MSVFKFKEFSVRQTASAMKIGTDAMILGSLIGTENAMHGLDVGTGTGVLALMVAQKKRNLEILGLEIEREAYEEASYNFENSPFNAQLSAIHCDFIHFEHAPFDLIFSNPPFFENSSKTNSLKRNLARHDDSLPLTDLFRQVERLLTQDGHFWVILPATTCDEYLPIAERLGLYPEQISSIFGKENQLTRKVVAFIKSQKPTSFSEFIVRNTDGTYTEMYKKLTLDYHFNQLK